MAALIWTLAWLSQVPPAKNEIPQPVNLTLTSVHFSHMLSWEPGHGTPTGVHYHVTMNTERGSSWVPVAGCERVQWPLVCNLTEAFADPIPVYLTQVTALLGAQASQPVTHSKFQPIKDTQLDLPVLTVTPCGSNLCVELHPPVEHLREHYNSLHYKLRVKSTSVDRVQLHRDTESLRRTILQHLAPGRQYCVSVCFSDSQVLRASNYSQPVCAFTAGIYTADALIPSVFCVLVISGVVVLALLVSTGFIGLKRKLPSVLTSIHHIEEVLVLAPCGKSLCSVLNLKPTPPSSDETRSSQTFSDSSDGESVTESPGGRRGGGYKRRAGTDLLSSASSSSASLSAQSYSEPGPRLSSHATSDFFSPQPGSLVPTGAHSSARLELALATRTAPPSDCPPADSGSLTGGKMKPNEEDKEVVGEGVQDVNLLTLTFGRQEEEEEKLHLESSFASEVYSATPNLPSQTWYTKEVARKTVSYSGDEEEEEECSGYMGRPCTDISQNLL